jgi:hypothetical protein
MNSKKENDRPIFIIGMICIAMSLLQYYAQVKEVLSKSKIYNNETYSYTANLNPDQFLYPGFNLHSKKTVIDLSSNTKMASGNKARPYTANLNPNQNLYPANRSKKTILEPSTNLKIALYCKDH